MLREFKMHKVSSISDICKTDLMNYVKLKQINYIERIKLKLKIVCHHNLASNETSTKIQTI